LYFDHGVGWEMDDYESLEKIIGATEKVVQAFGAYKEARGQWERVKGSIALEEEA
jgi:hypothetical protein